METETETAEGASTSQPSKIKGSFRRSARGKEVMRACAIWVIYRLAASGMTLEKWFSIGCNLSDIGINRTNAFVELQPTIPHAHEWYNESENGKQYPNWSAYFTGSLSNRIYYFFRKHVDGKIVVALAEWPGTVEDGVLVAPPEPEEA